MNIIMDKNIEIVVDEVDFVDYARRLNDSIKLPKNIEIEIGKNLDISVKSIFGGDEIVRTVTRQIVGYQKEKTYNLVYLV